MISSQTTLSISLPREIYVKAEKWFRLSVEHRLYNARVLADLARISVNQTPARATAQLVRVVNKWRTNIETGVDGPWQ